MTRPRRVDLNHAIIRDGLRKLGYPVFDCHALPGMLDIQVLSKAGVIIPMEIKSPGENLTPAEKEYLDTWPGFVVRSLDEALRIMQVCDGRNYYA